MSRRDFLSLPERIGLRLREHYDLRGYQPYKMSKIEPYDLYAQNRSFVSGGNILTFTDTNGRLMALKPDVTLSIIKNYRGGEVKVCYHESVFRDTGSLGEFREISQIGVERLGTIDRSAEAEMLSLARESLDLIGGDSILAVASAAYVIGLLSFTGADSATEELLVRYLRERNAAGMQKLCRAAAVPEAAAEVWTALADLYGPAEQVLPRLAQLSRNAAMTEAVQELSRVLDGADSVRIDFSIVTDLSYYHGIVFKGYLAGIHTAVLSGGRYDHLLRKFGKQAGAIGFAVYLDRLDEIRPAPEDGCVRIALPKGRLGEAVYERFERAGYACPEIREKNRKLIFENSAAGVSFFWVKPSDVASYVERGAADLGVCGSDILAEYGPDVFELADLGLGRCRMCVAAKEDFRDDPARPLRVATKFPNTARGYYSNLSREIDIIRLTGSIELAPIVGLSDVIVDIVETGSTLRANGLRPYETVSEISARLVANKAAYQFKHPRIRAIAEAITGGGTL